MNDIRDCAPVVEEAILDKDRFKITPIAALPANMMGFSYYAWRNSPLLVDRFRQFLMHWGRPANDVCQGKRPHAALLRLAHDYQARRIAEEASPFGSV